MTRVENFKTSFKEAQNISGFAKLLKDTEFKFTFFGYKSVSKTTDKRFFPKTVCLDKVASKALGLIRPFLKDWEFSLTERKHISYIIKKINEYYEKMDSRYEKSNIATKIFYFIRNMFSWLFQTREKWNTLSRDMDPSIYYSTNQYEKAFALNPLPNEPDITYQKINLYLKPPITISPQKSFFSNYFNFKF